MRTSRFARHAATVGLLAAMAAAPGVARAQVVGPNTPIVSMSLNPSDVALTVGQQQAVAASALLATGATRTLGGNGSIFWNISWTPGIDVSACGTGVPQFSSQNIQVDGTTGVFHATRSPTSPDTLKADGVMSLPTAVPGASVSAVLQCVNGASTGSMNALWNGTQYDGTFTFGAG